MFLCMVAHAAPLHAQLPPSDNRFWDARFGGDLGIPQDLVRAVAVSGRDVYVGGSFTRIGTNSFNRIARWDGTRWWPLGEGVYGSGGVEVFAIAVRGTNVYAGGFFDVAGDTNATRIARWDGERWHPLGSGIENRVLALAIADNGDVYAGGYFNWAGGVPATNIARWNGTNWSAVGRGLTGRSSPQVNALKFRGSDLFAGGLFESDFVFSMTNVARWNGTFWGSLGSGLGNGVNDAVYALEVVGTNLYVGGKFTKAGNSNANRVARFDVPASKWWPLGGSVSNGMNNIVYALAAGQGELFAGGWFTSAGVNSAARVARWNGTNWSALGFGVGGGDNSVYALGLDSWSLYVGGGFTNAGGKASLQIARYGNEPPTAPILQPADKTFLLSPGAVQIQVGAADRDGSITNLEILDRTQSLAQFTSPPWDFDWTSPPAGVHTLFAQARDDLGAASTSNPVNLFLSIHPQAQPPRMVSHTDSYCSMIIDSARRLFAWGRGRNGGLGTGTNNSPTTPVGIAFPPSVRGWDAVANGEDHTLAIGDDGHLYTWGYNGVGELGLGSNTAAIYQPSRVPLPPGATRWTSSAASLNTSFALTDQHQLYAWGSGFWGNLGVGDTSNRFSPTLVAPPAGATGWRKVAAGYTHTIGLANDGRVYGWGVNNMGQLGLGDSQSRSNPAPVLLPYDATNVIALAAGWLHSAVLLGDGRIFTWGYNGSGQLGIGTTGAGRNVPGLVQNPAGITGWLDLVVGSDYCAALAHNGQLYAWGDNNHGQMGHRNTTWQASPGLIPMPVGVSAWLGISAGYYHGLALGNDCQLYAWGENSDAQLGVGSTSTVTGLTPVIGLSNVCGALQTLPPTLTLDSPADGARFVVGETVVLAATAADTDGSIARVEFFSDATLLGAVSNSPFQLNWPASGSRRYNLSAIATDNLGAIAVAAPIAITVSARPTVNINSPANNTWYTEGDNVTFRCSSSDSDGRVVSVDWFNGNSLAATITNGAFFEFTWSNAPAGSFTFRAVATDNLGFTSTSAPVTININDRPSVTITSPTNGAVYPARTTLTIIADPVDSDGTINRVQFVEVGGAYLGAAFNPPYQITWQNILPGTHRIKATVYDNRNASGESLEVSFIANESPGIAIIAPGQNTVFGAGSNITVTVTISDFEQAITRADLIANGSVVASIAHPPAGVPVGIVWTNPPPGSHLLNAAVTDSYGATNIASTVSIFINLPPTVELLAPTNGAIFTTDTPISLQAQASDSDGTINSVVFMNHNSAFGISTSGGNPYSFSWNNPPTGTHLIAAWVTDNYSASATSGPVSIRITDRPIVIWQVPAENAVFTQGSDITLEAAAFDNDGSVARVDFYLYGTNLLGSATNAPFTVLWSNAPAGLACLSAVVVDDLGVTNAASRAILVNAPPAGQITKPTNGTFFVQPAHVTINGEASDSDGKVRVIEVFAGTNRLYADIIPPTLEETATLNPTNIAFACGQLSASASKRTARPDVVPFGFIWSNAPAGPHEITVTVGDDRGANSTSAIVQVAVLAQPPTLFAPVTISNFNRQSGLFIQTVRITNPTSETFPALRLSVALDTNSIARKVRLWNAVGTNDGIPFVLHNYPVPPGQSVDLNLEYYIPDRRTMPAPVFVVDVLPEEEAPSPSGIALSVREVRWLTNGLVRVEFATLSNRVYYVQYSPDMSAWRTALPAITGTGRDIQWLDIGPPKTDSLPDNAGSRFYRLILLP